MQTSETQYLDHSAEHVLGLFTTRDYFVQKYQRLGATDIKVLDCQDDGDHFAITVFQKVPQNTPLPGFLKKLVGARIGITQTDRWQRSTRQGQLDVVLQAAPVKVGVALALAEAGNGSRLDLTYDIHAPVPLIGGHIEKFLAGDVIARTNDDLDETRRMLAEGL